MHPAGEAESGNLEGDMYTRLGKVQGQQCVLGRCIVLASGCEFWFIVLICEFVFLGNQHSEEWKNRTLVAHE